MCDNTDTVRSASILRKRSISTGLAKVTDGELRDDVNGFLTSYATDSVWFSPQIFDKEHTGTRKDSSDDKYNLQLSVCETICMYNSQHWIVYKDSWYVITRLLSFYVDMIPFVFLRRLSFSNCLLLNSSSYAYLCRCSSHLWIPSLDTNSFIKITCDWQGTCNRLFLTKKQIIDDSLFSVTDYCWVYLGVKMFWIRVMLVIVILSSVLAWMYAVIKRVITNHNKWTIFSTNVSLRVQSYFWLFLLHGHLRVMRAMNIWTSILMATFKSALFSVSRH